MSEDKAPYSVPPTGGSVIAGPTERSIREATRILSAAHRHTFMFLLNDQGILVRGCTGCGVTDIVFSTTALAYWQRVKEDC